MKADTTSVAMPSRMPFGMSRFGSTDSSAASGSCSMARNSQTAKGRVASTPVKPNGNQRPVAFRQLACRPGAMFSAQRLKSMFGMALIQKITSTASESSVTISVTLIGERHAVDVERQEDDERDHPDQRRIGRIEAEDAVHVGGDEGHDHRRRHDVFDVLAEPGDEAAPRPHRRAREGIGGAGMRQRRAHLGDAEDEAEYT